MLSANHTNKFLVRDYSQYGEQTILLDYLARHPDTPRYLVDAGAYDGAIGSNSRALFLRGWAGTAVEPDPRSFARLHALYAGQRQVRCVRCALSDRPGLRRMRFSDGPPGYNAEHHWCFAQVNTFDAAFAAEYAREHNYRYRLGWVLTLTLRQVLWRARAPRALGFVSIDCEGEDMRVLRGLDLTRYRPRLLCLESDATSRARFAAYLAPFGYRFHAATEANTFFVSQEK